MGKQYSLPYDITVAEKYGPAMEITEQSEADACFERLVEHSMWHGYGRDEAERLERENLGYYAGYYSQQTRERVERLFSAQHPIFGSAVKVHTPDELFLKGALIGAVGLDRARPILDGMK